MIGGIFCFLSCLSVVNFNICYSCWIFRDRDFIFGIHTQLIMLFKKRHQGQWPCDLDFDLKAKNSVSDFIVAGGIVFQKHMYFSFLDDTLMDVSNIREWFHGSVVRSGTKIWTHLSSALVSNFHSYFLRFQHCNVRRKENRTLYPFNNCIQKVVKQKYQLS